MKEISLKEMSLQGLTNQLSILYLKQQKLIVQRLENTEEYKQIESEYNEVVVELWNRIPSLRGDVNLQLQGEERGKRL